MRSNSPGLRRYISNNLFRTRGPWRIDWLWSFGEKGVATFLTVHPAPAYRCPLCHGTGTHRYTEDFGGRVEPFEDEEECYCTWPVLWLRVPHRWGRKPGGLLEDIACGIVGREITLMNENDDDDDNPGKGDKGDDHGSKSADTGNDEHRPQGRCLDT